MDLRKQSIKFLITCGAILMTTSFIFSGTDESGIKIVKNTTQAEEEPVTELYVFNNQIVTDEEIELLALVCLAEAEGEIVEGKRLVIDTVLNRVKSEHFPNTITEVIYQDAQFTSMWNGRVNRVEEIDEETIKLVKEELIRQANPRVIFFSSDGYSEYGTPLCRVGNHYFSSYNGEE